MRVKSPLVARILTFLMVFGPGFIVLSADNDAGSVSTYCAAGAQYGTHLLWLLLILLPICYFIQEMVVRLGIVTGQGHAAMIYKRFGKKWGLFSLIDLLSVNFLTLVTEFAAISLACAKMGLNPMISVPVSAVALIALVFTGSYLRWERIVIFLCLLDIAWLGMAIGCGPDWIAVVHNSFVPSIEHSGITTSLIFIVIAIVGTTIAPWQLFFQQSCIADKQLRFSDLKWSRLDTLIGAVFTICIAGFMMIVGDAAYRHHIPFTDPAQMAMALVPIYGAWIKNLVLLMMINAAILGATTISLSSAWAYGEVQGWKHSLHKSIKEAPKFYAVYFLCIFTAAAVVLIPGAPLQLIIIGVQVLAGIMLPSAVIFLQLLLNDKELIGEEYVNKPWNNVVNWIIIAVLFILSFVLAIQVVVPNLLPSG